jgi:hypothetical protein
VVGERGDISEVGEEGSRNLERENSELTTAKKTGARSYELLGVH